MKTIEISLYKFDELSEQAQQKAVENELNRGIDTDFIYSDAKNTVEQFCSVFNCKTSHRSWLEFQGVNCDYWDAVMNFSTERLKKYIINNFGHILWKPKFIGSLEINEIIKHKRIKSKPLSNGNVFNPYYSGVQTVAKNCNLTGVCYDESILFPIYRFLEGKEYQDYNFEELLNACFQTLESDIDSEIESLQSFEYIASELTDGDYDFTENGEIF